MVVSDKDIEACQAGGYKFTDRSTECKTHGPCECRLPDGYECDFQRRVFGKLACRNSKYYPAGFFEGKESEDLPFHHPELVESTSNIVRARWELEKRERAPAQVAVA